MEGECQRLIGKATQKLVRRSARPFDCLIPGLIKLVVDPKFRDAYDALPKLKAWPRDGEWAKKARAQHDDPAFRAGDKLCFSSMRLLSRPMRSKSSSWKDFSGK